MQNLFKSDIEALLAKRFDNGDDLWATSDKRVGKGSPFSTIGSTLMLTELGFSDIGMSNDIADLLFSLWHEDGRFQTIPKSAIYPCQTANVTRVLCRMGYTHDRRLERTFEYFFETQHDDGGWRCNTYKYGRGPETSFSNSGTTLAVLDAFRFTRFLNKDRRLDQGVAPLLNHWETRKPLGPCHYGIGTLFMKTEYPFFRYNLFFYVYVLSFYDKAKKDNRFLEALNILTSKTVDGKIIAENPNRETAGFSFCKKGKPSIPASKRYQEILDNLG